MKNRSRIHHYLLSGVVTGIVAVFCVVFIIFYDWTAPVSPQFITQAVDCNQGFLCDWDGICDPICETSTTCPSDCHTCGNGLCEPTENNANCASDCPNSANCGNRYCESGEDYLSCASDCALCERQIQEFIYLSGCSDYNIQNGYNIDLENICACGSQCPIGMTGNFSCPYVGLFFQTEDGACDNGIDDDNDGSDDCADSDCFGDGTCCSDGILNGDEEQIDCGGSCSLSCNASGGNILGTIIVRDNDDPNSTSGTLSEVLGGADYLVIGYVETLCGPCQTFGNNLNANSQIQTVFAQGSCAFVTVTDPTIYNGVFSSWLDAVGAGSYVGTHSKELVSRNTFINTYNIQGSPQVLLVDAQGNLINSNIIASNNNAGLTFAQDFYTYCDSGGGTGSAEVCTGGVDEDLDTLIDCADSDCTQDPACSGGNGTGSAEVCTGGVDEDIDGLIDCADSDCAQDSACTGGGGGNGTGSAEVCTGGVDEDVDGLVDCADSDCAQDSACTGGGTTGDSCQDTQLNGTETDVDCGGDVCDQCATGKRCMVDTDCVSSTCVYGVVSMPTVSPTQSRSLQGGMGQVTLPVVTSSVQRDPSRKWYDNRLLIKFKKENNLLLPAYADNMILNSEERYIGYLIGKVTALYEQQGVAPLMMVRAVDQLFDYTVSSIDHVYDLAGVASGNDDLAQIYRITFDENNTDLDALVAQLQQNLAVEFIEKEPLYTLTYTDPQAVQQWHLNKVEADKARYAGASGNSSAVIAVIDNGFDLTHPDLVGALVPGRDVADNDSDPSLPNSRLTKQYGSHGTHTIGIAGAVTDNSLGVASVGGGVKVMPIKATSDVYDPVYVTHAYQALQYAVSRPEVDIISMSFGGPPSSTLESLIIAHPGKIFVAAAGNDNVSTPQYPAAYASVIAVAASNSFDDKAPFSNYGSWIDISAPGVSILSTAPSGTYIFHDGTSMATPLVASALGLLISLGDTTPIQTLLQTADPMNSSLFTSNLLGAGRINVCNAVKNTGIPCVSSSGGGSSSGGSSTGGTTTGSVPPSGGQGICLLLGSTGSGSTTTSGSTSGGSTSSQTGGGSTNTGQQYPVGNISISVNDSNPDYGDTIQWTMNWMYTTYGPDYPMATLDMYVNLPYGLTYLNDSYIVAGDGSFLGYDQDQNGDLVFVVKISGLANTTTSNSRVYAGTIRFKTTVASIGAGIQTNVVSSMQCYALSTNSSYVGSATCSTSSNRQSGIELSSDTQRVTISQSSSNGSTTNGSTTSTSGGTGAVVPVGGCRDGIVQSGEECDDGNALAGDGCSASCRVEQGRKCLSTSPSQCGSDDCFTHGKSFKDTNIFGSCCGGLSEIVVVPSATILSGVVKSHICYDPRIGQPVCNTQADPSGWRVPTLSASGSRLVFEDSCRSIYKDYYKDLLAQLQGVHTACVFADIPYDQVSFTDITSTKQKVSIQTLRDACIVQGVSQNLDTYGPNRPIQRAELIKMVVKLLILAEGADVQDNATYSGGVQFFDVPPTFWGAPYIDEAVRRGLLSARTTQGQMTFFKPHASVSREEFIALIRRIDVGQMLSRDDIESIVGKRALVTRASTAEVLVKKFLGTLQPYFYFQGDQEEYYWRLLEELRGKNYQQQYGVILSQIDKLSEEDEHGSPEVRNNSLDPYWMQQFLRQLIY